MNPLWHQIIASFTAAATVLTSLTCVCQGAIFPSGVSCHHESELAHDLCCHDDDQDAHELDAHDHDSDLADLCDQLTVKEQQRSCNHCQGSLNFESVGASSFAHVFDLTLSNSVLAPAPVAAFNRPTFRAQHFGDDPLPSSCASTLLRQHCALNT